MRFFSKKTRDKTLEQLAEKASQLDIQAFGVACQGPQSGDLNLAHPERLLRMCDVPHRMGRTGIDTSE